jgi:hypothetical protein
MASESKQGSVTLTLPEGSASLSAFVAVSLIDWAAGALRLALARQFGTRFCTKPSRLFAD